MQFFHRIDATRTYKKNHVCHLVNDCEHDKANAMMKKVVIDGKPYLALFARKNIRVDEEIVYDYGDDPDNLWWRKKVSFVV